MQQVKNFFSYFNPTTDKYEGAWEAFDSALTFGQQLQVITLTALAALVSLPILGLGGLAAFRALVNHYVPYTADDLPDSFNGNTAGKVHDIGLNAFNPMGQAQFVENAKRLFNVASTFDALFDPELDTILEELFDKYKNGPILLTALKVGNPSERLEILKDAQKLDGSMDAAQEFLQLMKFVSEIKAKRETAVPRLERFGEGISKAAELKSLHRALESIPVEEEEELLNAASIIFKNFKTALERINCLQVIRNHISIGKRADAIAYHQKVLSTITSPTILADVLPLIQEQTKENLRAVEELVLLLSNPEDDGTVLLKCLRCIEGVSDDVSISLLENIYKCLDGLAGENLKPVLQILHHISGLTVERRTDVVAVALTHIRSSMHPTERRLIMSALCDLNDPAEVNKDELPDLIKTKKIIMEFFGKISNALDKQEMMKEIQRIPENQRESLFSTISPVLPQVASVGQFKELITGIKMIAPQHRNSVIASLSGKLSDPFDWLTIVRQALQDTQIKADSKQYLIELLRVETDQEIALDIANKIWDNRNVFGVVDGDDGDELFILLLGIVPIADGHARSPYTLYGRLLKMDKEISTPEVLKPTRDLQGVRVKMNQPHFEKMVRETKRVTFEELDSSVTFEFLEKLFSSFETRLSRLSSEERNKVWTSGVANCVVVNGAITAGNVKNAYELLRHTFMGTGGYVNQILKIKGADHQVVPTGYLHVYAVIKYVAACSIEIQSGSGLSSQEETLLRMLSSIQNCATGKSEGFAAFYNQLPHEYRKFGAAAASTPAEKAKAYLGDVVQKVIGSYLDHTSINRMAKELIGASDDGQYVHTSKYLKNLIAKRVGMPWDISFDAYPGCINDTLFNRPLQDVLKIFYKHVTPEDFVNKVYKEMLEEIVPNRDEIKRIDEKLRQAKSALEKKMEEGNLPELRKSVNELNRQLSKVRIERNVEEVTRLTKELEEVRTKLKNEEERLGVASLKEKVELIEEEFEGPHKKVKTELTTQFMQLLSEKNLDGCFCSIDDTEMVYAITEKGVVLALIEAGYLAAS
ncbi:putative uncharacterized protein [Waddlia chondrophila 2032/99]|uniref:Uncharacterized protein n=1 Tax=Waddlia chondrophila 2032/99 TaxID=765953 RepID=F8LCD8_9BACT|nr:putative uncharacterized protein [Waddlia chondrophila 2032/99]